ncbi:MAG: LysE family transporter [Porticoccaceae bacterium]|jgi:threonine efflux protein|nr:LysE family transporter [Porticoccaceae bacterium]MBT7904903.1 LysE family transporter [Porticoccaceae bacterium]MDA7853413.1 LysE family transporter [Porticoccaceae bacterium]MDG1199745.1 LysE family transporter [Porticoccaceae bacterium]MDG1447486.1 LysE family transporter [Porticoccaceae bacterium]
MDLAQGLIIVTTVHLLAAAAPGPDFILVSQQTLSNGKRAGLLCSLGIALGLSVHILYSSLGLAALIANSSSALWSIKLLGGCYLIYLGISGLRARAGNHQTEQLTTATESSALKTIGLGFLCNALNPKAPIYFVSLFTIVLSQDTPAQHLLIYGLWMMVLQLAWFSFLTLLLSRPLVTSKFQRMGHWIDRVAGGAMLILGLKVLATRTQ